jgi:hypothetical protein
MVEGSKSLEKLGMNRPKDYLVEMMLLLPFMYSLDENQFCSL